MIGRQRQREIQKILEILPVGEGKCNFCITCGYSKTVQNVPKRSLLAHKISFCPFWGQVVTDNFQTKQSSF